MERSDDQKFAGLMAILATTFGKENTELRIEVYFESLKDFSIDEIEQAVYLAVKTLKFFPKPAELRELIEGDPDSRALIAWKTAIDNRDVRRTVIFDDPIIHYCLQEIFDGWMPFCEKTLEELKWEEKRFVTLYKLALRRPDIVQHAPTIMIGSHETQDLVSGFHDNKPQHYILKIETGIRKTKEIEAPKSKELSGEV